MGTKLMIDMLNISNGKSENDCTRMRTAAAERDGDYINNKNT